MRNIYLIFAIALVFLSSCSRVQVKFPDRDFVTVGTFNIEWLGDGVDDRKMRSEEEYRQIAELILEADFDVIGLQEIENKRAMKRLIKHLPGYDFHISDGYGSQNLAVIFRNNISVEYVKDYMAIAVEPGRTRPGMYLKCRKGNFDWYMMVVHFKATSRFDDTPEKRRRSIEMRQEQSAALERWIDSVLTNDSEQDLIIVGDFNDSPLKPGGTSLAPLLLNDDLIFLTDNLMSCKYENWYVIDHILVTRSAKNRFQKGSVEMHNFRAKLPEDAAAKISDHCPIGATFEVVSPDND